MHRPAAFARPTGLNVSGRLRRACSLLACALSALAMAQTAVAGGGPPQLRVALPPGPPTPESTEARLFTDEGFEADLARRIGTALGREVALVHLPQQEAARHLATGQVDMLLQRENGADAALAALDTGYSSALTVAMRSDTDILSWDDLAGRIVCLTEGNSRALTLATRHGAIPSVQRAPAISLMRVRTGDCDAGLHDEAVLDMLFADPEWERFSATLPPQDDAALTVALADPALRPAVEAALATLAAPEEWERRKARWARNVSFEVWLEQDAPDCH